MRGSRLRSATETARHGGDAAARSAKRKRVDPTTCERDYGNDEVEFMNAMQAYKVRHGRPFPTWSEVLEVLKGLGYRKAATP